MKQKEPIIEWDIRIDMDGEETTLFTIVTNMLYDMDSASGDKKKEKASVGVVFCEQFMPYILEDLEKEMPKTKKEWINLYKHHQQLASLFTFYRGFAMELYQDRLKLGKEVLMARDEVNDEDKRAGKL